MQKKRTREDKLLTRDQTNIGEPKGKMKKTEEKERMEMNGGENLFKNMYKKNR